MKEMPYGVLLLEPYYAGSHRQLIDLLHEECLRRIGEGNSDARLEMVTMSGKKWHWRARTSALHLAQAIPKNVDYTAVFASSVLPLHDLVALRPELTKARKILYFHENQLVYPVRASKARDFQYGYAQVLSCLVADVILFNSGFNLDSFLSSLSSFFKLQPDYRPKNMRQQIEPKCRVLYFPLALEQISLQIAETRPAENSDEIYRILWPHRWEFDKGPEEFFQALYTLITEGTTNFRLVVLGESFTDNPPVFEEAKERLAPYIEHFGFLPSKSDYFRVLSQSDVVVSTAHHEFFGVAMLEAAYAGAFPVCPKKLVYPEIFDQACLYDAGANNLCSKLKAILQLTRREFKQLQDQNKLDFSRFDWNILKHEYLDILLH